MIENRLSEILGRKRMNVSELARGARISRSAAHKLYHDTGASFDREVLTKVCSFLGVQVGEILVYAPADPAERSGEEQRRV